MLLAKVLNISHLLLDPHPTLTRPDISTVIIVLLQALLDAVSRGLHFLYTSLCRRPLLYLALVNVLCQLEYSSNVSPTYSSMTTPAQTSNITNQYTWSDREPLFSIAGPKPPLSTNLERLGNLIVFYKRREPTLLT